MKLVLIIFLAISFNGMAGTWCVFENFDVGVSGDYVYVHGSTLDSAGSYVFLGLLTTEKGRGIQALLLAAALSGKKVKYGRNDKDWKCGEFPTYNHTTINPEYLSILTKK